MAPPTFGDLGKDAREILSKQYYFGLLNAKLASTFRDFKITNSINQNFKIGASFESKLKIPEYGTTLTKKWSSENVMDFEVCIEDKIYKGLKQTFKYSRELFTRFDSSSLYNRVGGQLVVRLGSKILIPNQPRRRV
ncbi:unnamed protein product [Echinostoma caproni]|uniref:OMP_b-brl_3 domain-containing protein n=1 Tax=Echinostoma caproni TaxID=27848 RepID=A0A183AGA5_9TREM|nr:unnamed protein product [Echinostoma caproni]